jgi:hypothetical protein
MVEVLSASARIAGAALRAAQGKNSEAPKKRARSSEAPSPESGNTPPGKWVPKAKDAPKESEWVAKKEDAPKESEWVVKKPAPKAHADAAQNGKHDQRNGSPPGKTVSWVPKAASPEGKSEPKPRPPAKPHAKSMSPAPRDKQDEPRRGKKGGAPRSPEMRPTSSAEGLADLPRPNPPVYLEVGLERFDYREAQSELFARGRLDAPNGRHAGLPRHGTSARRGEISPDAGTDAVPKGHGKGAKGRGRRSHLAPPVAVVQEVASQLSRASKYETMVQLKKSFTVMAEIFDVHASSVNLPTSFKFLDLGAAPGGFSSFLLSDPRCERGFACTLQEDLGGFPFLIEDQRLYVRKCDLFTVEQIACPEVDLCTADAQYLRDYIAVGGKYNGTLCNMQMCGIWALTCREFTLGLERLAAGGNLIFRFSWRGLDGEEDDEPWYRGLTLKLFSLLYDVFGAVIFFKSEIAHTADETFYVICTGFKKSKYQESGVHDQLRGAETDLRGAPSEKTLFETDFMPGITVTEDVKEKIMGEMDRIEKIMAIGQAAREWSQAKWSKRMKEKEEPGDATETTKEGSGEGSVHSDVPPEVAGHCADQRFYRVRISPRPSAIVKARMIAVPNFRRLCQAHGRVERIWVDQNDDFILVWYSNWYGANQAFHRLRGQMQPWYDRQFKVELVKPNGGIEQMSVENPASDADFQGVPFVKSDTSDDWLSVPFVKPMEDLSRDPQDYYNNWQWQEHDWYYNENHDGGYSLTVNQERDYSPDGLYQELQRDYSPDGVYEDFRRDFSMTRFQNGIGLESALQSDWNVDAPAFEPVNGMEYQQDEHGNSYPFDVMGLPYPTKKGGKKGGKGKAGGKAQDAGKEFKFDANAPVFRSTSPVSISPSDYPPQIQQKNPLEAVGMARVRHAAEASVPPLLNNPLRPDKPLNDQIIPPPKPVGEPGVSTSSSELRQRHVDPNAAEHQTEAPEWTEDAQSKPDKEALVRFEGKRKKPKGLAGIRLKDMASIPQEEPYSVTDTLLWYLMRMVCFYCLVRGVQVGFVMYYTAD